MHEQVSLREQDAKIDEYMLAIPACGCGRFVINILFATLNKIITRELKYLSY